MPTIKLSRRTVEAAPIPVGKDAYYWDNKIGGFGIRVTPKGVRSYVVQYRLPGQQSRRLTLGKHGSPWTPEQARSYAIDLLTEVRKGIDPVQVRRDRARAAKEMRFDRYVEDFCNKYLKAEWPDSWTLAKRRLDMYAVPVLRSKSLPEISKRDIVAIIDPIRDQRALARNTHAVLRMLFNWAVDRDDLDRSPMHGLKAPPAPKARRRVLSPDEILALWLASYELNPPFDTFIRLLICTLQRRQEVAALPWAELNQDRHLWQLDGSRAKNGTSHIVSLNGLAMAELKRLGWKKHGLVLTTTGETPISGFSKQKARLNKLFASHLQRIVDARASLEDEEPRPVEIAPWVLHDIRRTGTTQLQALGIPIEVTERCINHVGTEVAGIRGVYNRYEYLAEKSQAFRAWGGFLERLLTDNPLTAPAERERQGRTIQENDNVVYLSEVRPAERRA